MNGIVNEKDGGPAFPWQWHDHLPEIGHVVREQGFGLTLRDWFAGMALTGLMSDPEVSMDGAIRLSFEAADKMLIERSK